MWVVEEFYSTNFHIRDSIEMSLGFDGEMITLSTPRSTWCDTTKWLENLTTL